MLLRLLYEVLLPSDETRAKKEDDSPVKELKTSEKRFGNALVRLYSASDLLSRFNRFRKVSLIYMCLWLRSRSRLLK